MDKNFDIHQAIIEDILATEDLPSLDAPNFSKHFNHRRVTQYGLPEQNDETNRRIAIRHKIFIKDIAREALYKELDEFFAKTPLTAIAFKQISQQISPNYRNRAEIRKYVKARFINLDEAASVQLTEHMVAIFLNDRYISTTNMLIELLNMKHSVCLSSINRYIAEIRAAFDPDNPETLSTPQSILEISLKSRTFSSRSKIKTPNIRECIFDVIEEMGEQASLPNIAKRIHEKHKIQILLGTLKPIYKDYYQSRMYS